MSLTRQGYKIINFGNKKKLINLRNTFIKIFSLASKLNGFKDIKNEAGTFCSKPSVKKSY